VRGDVAILVHVFDRFMADKALDRETGLRFAGFHLRKLALRTLNALVADRVSPDYLARYVAGEVSPFERGEEVSETGLFYALARGDPHTLDRWLVGMGERAFHRWLEQVCLDEGNGAFETQESPFDDRETEVLRAVNARGGRRVSRGKDLVPYLRQRGNRDCLRVLQGLEAWFLRQYDVSNAAAAIQHLAALAALTAPFVAALFVYTRAPRLFDLACSLEVGLILAAVFWFLLYRFCWKRDLTFFHASVPRIGAGIIVGYLPVFLIDEVWDLADESWGILVAVVSLLGFATLLYLYVEVQRRLGDSQVAFARARAIFLLGVVEALALGLIMTSLFGRFMAERNWTAKLGEPTRAAAFEAFRATAPAFAGQLPPIVGFEPLLAFPSAVLLMTFLSFFIGTFLQLMWEDIPLTEPL
jgi:hypothetical protein